VRVLRRLLLLVLAAAFLLPLLWMLAVALQPDGTALTRSPWSFPDGAAVENFRLAAERMGGQAGLRGFGRLVWNTSVLTVLSIAGQLFCCSLAGFAFACLRFRGRDALFLLVLATMMLPPQVLAVPQFLLYRELGLVDTWGPLLLPTVLGGAPFFIFLFRQAFLSLPPDLLEAARLDGCGFFAQYRRVALPLVRPVTGAVALFTFLATWNDFWAPLIYLNSEEKQTLTLALAAFQQSYRVAVEWLMAGTSLVLAPCLLVYFLAQGIFLRGVRLRSAKG